MAHYRLLILSVCLVLPACFHISEKRSTKKTRKKESSQSPEGFGSIFTPVSESSVRDDVREHHKLEASSAHELSEGQEKVAEPLDRRLTRKEREVLMLERAREQQAKLVDIPVPLNVDPISDFFESEAPEPSQGLTLGYYTEMSVDDVMKFYQQEMERHGWRLLADASGPELLANFIKPGRFCSVSIRPDCDRTRGRKGSVEIVIFTGPASDSV